jgi:tetratricopeptide (TPR) repeat protein
MCRNEPVSKHFRVEQACILLQRTEYEPATAELNDAVEKYPDCPQFRALRGLSRAEAAEHEDDAALSAAEADVAKAANEEHLKPLVRTARGIIAYKKLKYDEAVADLSWLIENGSDNSRVRKYRGCCHTARGDFDRAISDFMDALERDASELEFWQIIRLLAEAHQKKGDFDRALGYHNLIVQTYPADPNAYFDRATLLATMGRNDRALDDMDRIVRLLPQEPGVYMVRALMCVLAKSDWDRALADMNCAIALEPRASFNYACRAFLHIKKSNYIKSFVDLVLCVQTLDQTELKFYWRIDRNRGVFIYFSNI